MYVFFMFQMQTVAKNRNMWVDNADRMVAGFLEMFEEGCHKMVRSPPPPLPHPDILSC